MPDAFKLFSQEASIVLVGSFNPAIFHPEWLLRNKLIPEDDLKDMKLKIVHPDISQFQLSWVAFEVMKERFLCRTNDPSKFKILCDLVVSVFQILEHTPLTAIGMNLIRHFEFDSEELWHKVGDVLCPKSIWEKNLPPKVGLKLISVQAKRIDNLPGFIQVNLGPSEKKRIEININNHVELAKDDKSITGQAAQVLSDNWDKAMSMADCISNSILKEAVSA